MMSSTNDESKNKNNLGTIDPLLGAENTKIVLNTFVLMIVVEKTYKQQCITFPHFKN